ncbi:hypothetical protein DFR52_102662 [Hoeflea marina]|uniref:Uncharacterized protein n=1 Tax=Hoeflea marina TaxID=274592 RepID=A0A317PMK9_9HYPH|nr:hypothetical protein DFR52_102662 [Hoeflea marina]
MNWSEPMKLGRVAGVDADDCVEETTPHLGLRSQ